MFKKTIEFEDLDGNPQTQTFYFNYSRKEIMELIELDDFEGRIEQLKKPTSETGLSEAENARQAFRLFEDLILGAYGEKGADNVTFKKSPELKDYFRHHQAFEAMIFEFMEHPNKAAEFIEQAVPAKFLAEAKKAQSEKLSSEDIKALNDEAARRQANPETRIEPGMDAAIAAGVATPEAAEALRGVNMVDEKPTEQLTGDDIGNLSEEVFAKLDVRKLSKDAMIEAFKRKSAGA